MNKNLIIALVVSALLLATGSYFFLSGQTTSTNNAPEDQMADQEEQNGIAENSENARYINYSEGVLEENSNKRRVLYFYANWCPTCRPADKEFMSNQGQIPEDVALIRVNYNDSDTDQAEEELAEKYNITYQHTFVQIDSAGNAVKTWNGGKLDELLGNLI